MIRTKSHILPALLACGLAMTHASAQLPNLTEQLAPCLSDDTVMVARIDVPRVDVEALARMAVEAAGDGVNSDRAAVQRQSQWWQQHVTRFKEAGGESLFVLVNPSDVLLAVPGTPRLDEPAMKAWFDALAGRTMATFQKGGLLVATRPWTLQRRRTSRRQGRPN